MPKTFRLKQDGAVVFQGTKKEINEFLTQVANPIVIELLYEEKSGEPRKETRRETIE